MLVERGVKSTLQPAQDSDHAGVVMSAAEPVFKQALQTHWDALAPIIQAHYDLSPFTDQSLQLKGCMDNLSNSMFTNLLIPFTTLVGALVPYRGKKIAVEVVNQTHSDKAGFYWQRTFSIEKRKPFIFKSVMHCTGPQEITEYLRFGFGIRFKLTENKGGLIYQDNGHVWKVGQRSIPVPINYLIGKAYIEEMPVSDTEFSMMMVLTHPIFGQTFQYNGRFSIIR
jgi:hypothetical protein